MFGRSFFFDNVQNFCVAIVLDKIQFKPDHFATGVWIGDAFDHDTRTNCGHGGLEIRANNGRHQIAAKGRSGHHEALCFILNVKCSTISSQTGMDAAGNSGRKIAPNAGRAKNCDLGLVLPDHG